MKKTFLFWINSDYYGGAEKYIKVLLEKISTHSDSDFLLVTPPQSKLAAIVHQYSPAVECVGVDIGPKLGSKNWKADLLSIPLYFYRVFGRFLSIQRKSDISCVCVQYKKEQVLVSLIARMFSIPVVWVEHGPIQSLIKKSFVNTAIYRLARYVSDADVVVGSVATYDSLKLLGINTKKMHLINYGIEVQKYQYTESQKKLYRQKLMDELAIPQDSFIVSNICFLNPTRGQDYFIIAAAQLVKRYPKMYFLVVGSGPEKSNLEALASKYAVNSKVLFTGYREDLDVVLAASDIFVNSSFAEGEGMGLRMLEAQAAGVPIIATDIGGTREIVKTGQTGILISVKDSDAIINAIDSLIADPALASRMAKNALDMVTLDYNTELMAARTWALLNNKTIVPQN